MRVPVRAPSVLPAACWFVLPGSTWTARSGSPDVRSELRGVVGATGGGPAGTEATVASPAVPASAWEASCTVARERRGMPPRRRLPPDEDPAAVEAKQPLGPRVKGTFREMLESDEDV